MCSLNNITVVYILQQSVILFTSDIHCAQCKQRKKLIYKLKEMDVSKIQYAKYKILAAQLRKNYDINNHN